MLVKNLGFILLSIGLSVPAFAKDIVVSCRGSESSKMTSPEKYFVSVTDVGNVMLEGQHKQTPSIFINVDRAEVIQKNDDEGLLLESSIKRVGMVISRQKIDINYKTGRGTAEDVAVLGSKNQPHRVYLDSCVKL